MSEQPPSQRQVQALIAQFVGQANVLVIPRKFVEWTGSLEAALLLSQLLYWSERTSDPEGWIYKTAAAWHAELGITEYSIRKARKTLEDFGVESVVKAVNNTPTVHYRINGAKFYKCILQLLQMHSSKTQNAFFEIEGSTYTENTSEITYLPETPVLATARNERPQQQGPDKPVASAPAPTPTPAARPQRPPVRPVLPSEAAIVAFDSLWANYPRLNGMAGTKKLAKAAFALVEEDDWPDLLRAVDKYRLYCGPNGENHKPKYCENWLTSEGWRDVLAADLSAPARNGNSNGRAPAPGVAETERMLAEIFGD